MDRRMSQSLPMLFTPMCYTPLCYRDTSPMWAAHHSRHRRRKHYYVGGVRTQLIGADSYPNPSRSPRRVVLCGPSGSYQRMTRSSSTAELSRTAVYCSREDLRNRKSPPPRAVSCEDVFRGTSTTGLDSSRFSESGVSLNDSRTDAGSCAALEDVDGVSQYSFGSSSAFHEITCDSEMDRPDSDCLSVPGSGYGYSHDRFRDSSGHDSESRGRRRDRGGHPRKIRHDSGSREKFLAELTAASSGRSSPRGGEEGEEKEFFHSTPTKRGSPILSIFPADDEDDIHFPSHLPKDLLHDSLNQSSVDSLLCPTNDSFPDSLPTSPCEHRGKRKEEEEEEETREDIRSSMEAVKEALNRRRRQFYASFHHDQQQQQPSPGDSVQTWVSTGHPQHHTLSTSPLPLPDTPSHHDTHQQQQEQQQQQQEQQQQSHQGQPQLSPSSAGKVEGRSVRDRVRAIEQGQDFQTGGADQPPTPAPLTGPSSSLSASEEEDGRRGIITTTTTTTTANAVFTPLAASEGGGGVGKLSSSSSSLSSHQQLHSPLSSFSSPGTQLTTTPPLLNNEPDSPYGSSRRRDGRERQGKDRNSVDDAERQKVSSSTSAGDPWNELSFCEDDHSTSLSSPSFRDNRREINQGERGVSSGSGVEGSGFLSTTNLSEADGTCLQLITTGGDDQGSEANYLAVSGDDRYANTGAKLVTANTTTAPPLQSADAGPTAVTSGSGIPDVYQRENRLCGIEDGETNLTAEGATSVETGVTTSVAWGKDSEEKEVGDSETNLDPRYAVQEREFERLVSEFSDIDNLNEDESVDNESGSKNKQDPSLYHARPIQITSPDSGDNSPLVAVHSHDSTPSLLLLQDSDVTPEGDADDNTAPDREDAEVQSLLQGSVDTLSEAASSCDWQQGQRAATDMEYHIHLLPSSTDPALDPSAAALGVMTVREVSQHHTRHVHHKHTTVQETVTTRRTTVHQQHEGSSPTSMLKGGGGSRAEGIPACENTDFELTDTTVSRITVTERNNEMEESTTRKTTRVPQSPQMMDTNVPEDSFTTFPHTDAGSGTISKTAHTTQQQGGGYTDHAEAMLKQADVTDSRHVLDDLQDQLSVLSSEHPSLDSAVSSVHRLSPPFGYKDHAEASLPQTESNSVINKNSVVRGTGSVSITLDRPGCQQQIQEDPTSDTRQISGTDWTTDQVSGTGSKLDAPLYRARAVQILPAGDRTPGCSTESRQEDLAASSRHGDSSWGLTGSSSEINDSDDRCTPASAAGSHRTLLHSDSDSCAEGKSIAHALQDFLATMQGQQLTSDQPSLHRSVDVMEEDFPPHMLLHPHFLQETILEADDEGGSTEEDAPLNSDIDSYKSSLHFCVPESTPSKVSLTPSVLHAQQHQQNQNAAASESRADVLSAEHSLHDLSERFTTVRDISHQRGNKTPHLTHSDSDLSVSQHAQFNNLLSSEVNNDDSAYTTSASGDVQQKASEMSARHRLQQTTPSQGLTNRRLSSSSSHRGPKKAQWVQDKVHLFQKLLNDFEWQSKTSEQKLMDEMVTTDTDRNTRRRKGDDSALEKQQSGFCDDLYRLFTREHLEMRQNHVCPVVEDHMPTFRFKRFLRKKHNSKLKGHAHSTVRIRHQLEGLEETSPSPRTEGEKLTPSDAALAKTRHPPYHLHPAHRILSPGKQQQQQQLLRGRYVSDVFTDDADVNRSMSSDSAYSSLSGTLSSRHVSDLDSTFRSVTGSSADVSINSSVADVSLAEDKLRSLSDVFDHPEMFEGDVDEARLDRLMVGHHKAETL